MRNFDAYQDRQDARFDAAENQDQSGIIARILEEKSKAFWEDNKEEFGYVDFEMDLAEAAHEYAQELVGVFGLKEDDFDAVYDSFVDAVNELANR